MTTATEMSDTILVVDDEPAVRKTFQEWLEQSGFGCKILTAADAEQALAFTAMLGGDIPAALAHARSSLARAERLGDPGILALARCRVALNEFLSGQGLDRGKWDVTVTEEADAPLLTIEAVVRGVQRRSGDGDDPIRLSGDEFRAALPAPVTQGA